MPSGEFWDSDNGYTIKYDGRAQPRDFSERNKAQQRRLDEQEFNLGETTSTRRTRRPPLGKIPNREYFFLRKNEDGQIRFTEGNCPVKSRLRYAYGRGLETREIAKNLLYPLHIATGKEVQEEMYNTRMNMTEKAIVHPFGGTADAHRA